MCEDITETVQLTKIIKTRHLIKCGENFHFDVKKLCKTGVECVDCLKCVIYAKVVVKVVNFYKI